LGGWQNTTLDQVPDLVARYGDCGIGLLLGTEVSPGQYLIAVDIDAEDLVEDLEAAIGIECPTKVGKKGKTLFVRCENRMGKKLKLVTNDSRPIVEYLGDRNETVLPPTIHPDTGQPYRWVTKPLLEWDLTKLPLLTSAMQDEIESYSKGSTTHFQALNRMVWKGVGGGGNTHDTCHTAVASMVNRKWSDADIRTRIKRAKREACARAGTRYHWPEEDKVINEWISSARNKGMGESNKKVPPERAMANWAIGYLGGPDLVKTSDGVIRSYHSGHWPPVDRDALMQEMFNRDPALRNRDAKESISVLATLTDVGDRFGRTPDMWPAQDPKRQRICLLNGTLNLKTGQLEEWSPQHEIRHQLPFEWDPTAVCELYDETVRLVFQDDVKSIELWDEFCALTLVDDMSFQKVLFLRGSGANGKSTLANVLQSMHDPNAVSTVAITDLDNERKRSSLLGRLVNISTEQSRLSTVSDAYLKKITGGDPVDIRFLYKEVRNNVRLSVRFLELVNEMPTTADQTDAFRRRLIILNCPHKFESPILDFHQQIIRERPGILLRWTVALRNLYERGRFDEPGYSGEAVAEYILDNDPVRRWLESCTNKDRKGQPNADLYSHFRNWEKAAGHQYTTSEPRWSQKLTAMGYPRTFIKLGAHVVQSRKLAIKKGQESPL
jgi:P4 family phage/plasmid primase-like protien